MVLAASPGLSQKFVQFSGWCPGSSRGLTWAAGPELADILTEGRNKVILGSRGSGAPVEKTARPRGSLSPGDRPRVGLCRQLGEERAAADGCVCSSSRREATPAGAHTQLLAHTEQERPRVCARECRHVRVRPCLPATGYEQKCGLNPSRFPGAPGTLTMGAGNSGREPALCSPQIPPGCQALLAHGARKLRPILLGPWASLTTTSRGQPALETGQLSGAGPHEVSREY